MHYTILETGGCHESSRSHHLLAIKMALNRESSSPSEVFECFNIKCNASFTSEGGLRQHLCRGASCKEYMLIAPICPLASNLEIVGGQRRAGYSVESTDRSSML